MSIIIDDLEDDDWTINQMLLQHKNMVNDQINILLKEKKKYDFDTITTGCRIPISYSSKHC